MAWTEDNIARLKEMWAAGSTGGEIAERLGKSRSAVIGKAHRLNLTARHNPADVEAAFERVVDRVVYAPLGHPVTIEEAARAEGVSPQYARVQWMRRINATHGGNPQ